jgi:hypothetical protein
MTPKRCQDAQEKCQANVCKKIDELKTDAKEDRLHYFEIKEALARIEVKLEV